MPEEVKAMKSERELWLEKRVQELEGERDEARARSERCLAIAKEAEDESQEAEEHHKVECAELRQRVEELEAYWKDFMKWDESAVMYDWKQRAEAAESKLEKEKLAAKAWEATAEANYVEVEQLRAALKLCVEIVEDEYCGVSEPPTALVAARAALAEDSAGNPYGFAR